MPAEFQHKSVTIVLGYSERLPYERSDFIASVRSALEQDYADVGRVEVIVTDDRGDGAAPDYLPDDVQTAENLRHVPGSFKSRAVMYNAAIRAATGDYVLLVSNDAAQVVLKRSAARTMVMAAARHPQAGMVYADYERIDVVGHARDVHLLDWHEGRLRDSTDFGAVILHPASMLRAVGGLDERLGPADLYDLRLKVSERGSCIHVANRYAGSLYSVKAPGTDHNVFAYLLADKAAQKEMESVLTEHLQRTGAYLTPGAHVRRVSYTPEEERRFADCVASVVIPVNNRPKFIGRAIESVQRQTVPQVEVIVVINGGDSDPTVAAVRRYLEGGDLYDAAKPPVRMIVVDVNNLGLCLNSGIAAAAGKLYVQLDSDDRLKPDAVAKLVAVFDSAPTIGMVIGSYEVWNLNETTGEIERNTQIPVVAHDEWTADNGRNNLLRINGAGAPRAAHIKAIADAGWFGVNDDPHCRNYGEDYDLVLRISERYTIGRVWEPIYEVIRHSGGTDHSIDQQTIDRNDNAKDHMRLNALARRRALNAGK